jgi:hypothetical protein
MPNQLGLSMTITKAACFVSIMLMALPVGAQIESFRLFDQHGKTHSSHTLTKFDELHFIYANRECIESISEKEFRATLAKYQNAPKQTPEGKLALILLTDDSHAEREYYRRFDHIVLFDDLDFLIQRLRLSQFGDRTKVIGNDYGSAKSDVFTDIGSEKHVCRKKVFESQIAPTTASNLFKSQCLECHMRISQYDFFKDASSLNKWKNMSLKTIETFRMPPGGIDPELRHPIKGLLKRSEIKEVYQWLSRVSSDDRQLDRSLKSMRNDISRQIAREQAQFTKPILQFRSKQPTAVAANQPDLERYSVLGGPLDSDYFIHSAKFENSSKAVHHTTLFTSGFKPEGAILNQNSKYIEEIKRNSQLVTATIDGVASTALEYESNISFTHHIGHASNIATYDGQLRVKVPKNSYLSVNNHYPTSDLDVSNISTVQLFGEKAKTSKATVRLRTVQANRFLIPKGRDDYWIRFRIPVKQDILIHSFHAHTHYRGSEVAIRKVSKSGSSETLGSIPFLLFKHGIMPFFEKPILVEMDSELVLEARLDNSRFNISNPNSKVDVPHGLSIYHNEMCILFYTYSLPSSEQAKAGAEATDPTGSANYWGERMPLGFKSGLD